MGKIKSLREDIIRPTEARVLLKMAGIQKGPTLGPYFQAVLGFCIGYGKRISEILALRRAEVRIEKDFINTRFLILKVKPKSGILPYSWKKLVRSHYTCEFIEPWINSRPSPGSYIFPSLRSRSMATPGHVSRQCIWNWMKDLDPDIWPHLFRHSLATQMGEEGATAFELKSYFDWEDIRTAQRYVRETPIIRDKWTRREF